jgi:hypothetical protein
MHVNPIIAMFEKVVTYVYAPTMNELDDVDVAGVNTIYYI